MLKNMREVIDGVNEIEEMQDLMLEATDSTIADVFIDEDGEAEIAESELEKIMSKIPAYDEEKELNKKLSMITEAFIPEEIEWTSKLNEGYKPFRKMTDAELEEVIRKNRHDYDSFTSNPYYNPKDASDYLTATNMYSNVKQAYEELERRKEERRLKEERRGKLKTMFGRK